MAVQGRPAGEYRSSITTVENCCFNNSCLKNILPILPNRQQAFP